MAKKYIIKKEVFDRRDLEVTTIGIISEEDLDNLRSYLETVGYIAKISRSSAEGTKDKKEALYFEAGLDVGDHHGDWSEGIAIIPYEEPEVLTEEKIKNILPTFKERGFHKIEPGYFSLNEYCNDDDE